MGMHRDAAHEIPAADCPTSLIQAAKEDWDRAVALGERHGYRNAQATVIAPTGTIGLLMDCDTTGIEPDFSLVKFKKLAGGGYFKIVNKSVSRALTALGYTPEQIEDILAYVTGTLSLAGAPHVNRESLLARGFTADDVDAIEAALPGVFDLRQAFGPSVLGPATLGRIGISEADMKRPGFDILARLNFSTGEIAEAEEVICGRMTVEEAPHLKPEHLPVFDCANRSGKHGQRYIDPMGHIRMMAAVQPFISGAISKTINMPEETTVKEIHDAYIESWRLGLKAVAIYRDGCKRSQPLSNSSGGERAKEGKMSAAAMTESAPAAATAAAPSANAKEALPSNTGNGDGHPGTAAPPAPAPARSASAGRGLKRQRLPRKRRGFTQEARVAGHKVYVRTGEYPDGRLGEICLPHGVPLEEYVDAFIFTRFDPQGPVDHENIKYATSVIDYIFRVLGMEYLGRTDFVQVKPADADSAEEKIVEAMAADATGNGGLEEKMAPVPDIETPVQQQLRLMMGDAPFCDVCGHITVRNGTCYKCMQCGNSMGCS
jgi:ribonucleoside-diphosphate reductase alpha chain